MTIDVRKALTEYLASSADIPQRKLAMLFWENYL